MIVGTNSDVGKSWVVTGICRWLKNRSYDPAPFKSQNMSLNSFVTKDGKEIGRAQAVQAEACKLLCQVEMNPILLKPSGETKSQVVLNGVPIGSQTAKDYFLGNNKKQLFEEAKKAFNTLSKKYNPIVMEGAGSISELNLKHRDIVNMRMAEAANACVYLIADIDKGGVFGSVYGTIALLEDWEKKLLKGIIINKFRGDPALFNSGIKKLEEITGYPVLGVLPYAKDIIIEEEDSLALEKRNTKSVKDKLNVAVIQLHYISNYTDFQPLEQNENIQLYFTRNLSEINKADVIILPGTKNTLIDYKALEEEGIAALIKERYQDTPIIGICGGYQMMGKTIADPHKVESNLKTIKGLGLFDIDTVLTETKKTVQQEFQFKDSKHICSGYEIHMGETKVPKGRHLNTINTTPEGYFDGKRSWGTYFHGIFDNSIVVDELLELKYGKSEVLSHKKFKEDNYEKLAKLIDEHLDMSKILKDISVC
ncbi:cobyric acid synthase [uncultured Aquimarina sp.]|uniref:cobyric acid synthase n=1 Tax=uncultured Aquimarina sp. TaxID=575652 RepID=UPI0026347A3E|nr:cobyric acid synthase [uncultured Aquimarina sp.]